MNELVNEAVWASLVKFCQDFILKMKAEGISDDLQFIDWETHANWQELPNSDLIGPTSIGVWEDEKIIHVTFAIAVSSYNEKNLFRHRRMIARVFDRMRTEKQISFYDLDSLDEAGKIIMIDGTTVPPMSRAEVRPWQFVQGEGLLLPSS